MALKTLSEGAQCANISKSTLKRLIASGALPVVQFSPKIIRLRAEDLEELIRARTVRIGGAA